MGAGISGLRKLRFGVKSFLAMQIGKKDIQILPACEQYFQARVDQFDAARRNKMDIIVTDVTNMADGHICVAGWSQEEGRMIRPLHANGHPHWPENMAHDGLFCPGNIVTIEPSGRKPNRGNPHSTEDLLISGEPVLSGKINEKEMVDIVTASVFGSVNELFGETFQNKKFVPDGTGLRSLGAVEFSPDYQVRFYDSYEKLTCWFVDRDKESYSFKISSRALTKIYQKNGTAGLYEMKSGASKIHIRIGLAKHQDVRDRGTDKLTSVPLPFALVFTTANRGT